MRVLTVKKRVERMISERRHAILNLIIEYYLRTGEPIGSKTLCQLLPYPVSSATVRNEMAYLSQLGFLEQRHTSGGRVPGKASYRYYVDTLMKENPVSDYDARRISETLSINSGAYFSTISSRPLFLFSTDFAIVPNTTALSYFEVSFAPSILLF